MRAVGWAELIEHCSRLHTSRRRRTFPADLFPDNDEMREDSQMLDVLIDGEPATVVPTRMHEPGFYVRSRNGQDVSWMWRSDDEIAAFQLMARAGRVLVAADLLEVPGV